MIPKEPVFSEPWHAQVFAVTVHLNETGQLAWPDWAKAFSATLTRNGLHKDLDGGDDYFAAWLETLEHILVSRQMAEAKDLTALKNAWTQAYLSRRMASRFACANNPGQPLGREVRPALFKNRRQAPLRGTRCSRTRGLPASLSNSCTSMMRSAQPHPSPRPTLAK